MMCDRLAILQKWTLVGIWFFTNIPEQDIYELVRIKWMPILGYPLKARRLMNSWYIFQFMHQDDIEQIMKIAWVWGHNFLLLYRWYVGFNPIHDMSKKKFVWVQFLGLPLE